MFLLKTSLLTIIIFIIYLSYYFFNPNNFELKNWQNIPVENRNLSEKNLNLCRKDETIYKKQDVIKKAKLQFLFFINKKIDDYKTGNVLDASGEAYLDTSEICSKNKFNCKLYQSNLQLNTHDAVKFLNNKTISDSINLLELKEVSSKGTEFLNPNQTYVVKYPYYYEIFPINCCSIIPINEYKEFDIFNHLIKQDKNNILIHRPDLKLFIVNSIHFHSDNYKNLAVNNIFDKNFTYVFIIDNCGDIFSI